MLLVLIYRSLAIITIIDWVVVSAEIINSSVAWLYLDNQARWAKVTIEH